MPKQNGSVRSDVKIPSHLLIVACVEVASGDPLDQHKDIYTLVAFFEAIWSLFISVLGVTR